MLVLLTPREIQYIPVNVETIKIINPKKFDTSKIIITKIINVINERSGYFIFVIFLAKYLVKEIVRKKEIIPLIMIVIKIKMSIFPDKLPIIS